MTAHTITPKNQIVFLRISIGVIYLWFGALKFFPGVSPAENLAKETIGMLTFNLIDSDLSLTLLAIWETAVGLLLIGGFFLRAAIAVALVHMALTFAPLFMMPEASFTQAPLALTLVGQYIIKNLVIVCALLVIRSVAAKK